MRGPRQDVNLPGILPRSRTAPCKLAEARARLRTAQAYLEVADLVLDERDRDEYLNVAVGLAVNWARRLVDKAQFEVERLLQYAWIRITGWVGMAIRESE